MEWMLIATLCGAGLLITVGVVAWLAQAFLDTGPAEVLRLRDWSCTQSHDRMERVRHGKISRDEMVTYCDAWERIQR
jgi:hypothetical protein